MLETTLWLPSSWVHWHLAFSKLEGSTLRSLLQRLMVVSKDAASSEAVIVKSRG